MDLLVHTCPTHPVIFSFLFKESEEKSLGLDWKERAETLGKWLNQSWSTKGHFGNQNFRVREAAREEARPERVGRSEGGMGHGPVKQEEWEWEMK